MKGGGGSRIVTSQLHCISSARCEAGRRLEWECGRPKRRWWQQQLRGVQRIYAGERMRLRAEQCRGGGLVQCGFDEAGQ